MKKIGTFLMTTMICGVMACGNSKAPTSAQNETEIIETEQEDDTSLVSFSREVTHEESEKEGFGRCAESGCHCKAFKGRGQTCGNCGHAYRRHY